MNDECIVGAYDSLKQAEQAVRILHRAGFPTPQISLVASSAQETPGLKEEFKMGDDSVRDAAIGAGLGGVLGMLTGFGAMAVAGAGIVVFLAGPVGIAALGTVVGAFLGGIAGWGVREEHIRHYEQCVKDGKVLVIANGNPLELVHAERILKETDVAEVHVHSRTSSDCARSPRSITAQSRIASSIQRQQRPAAGQSDFNFPLRRRDRPWRLTTDVNDSRVRWKSWWMRRTGSRIAS